MNTDNTDNTDQKPNIASKADEFTAILKSATTPLTEDEKAKIVALRAVIENLVSVAQTGAWNEATVKGTHIGGSQLGPKTHLRPEDMRMKGRSPH